MLYLKFLKYIPIYDILYVSKIVSFLFILYYNPYIFIVLVGIIPNIVPVFVKIRHICNNMLYNYKRLIKKYRRNKFLDEDKLRKKTFNEQAIQIFHKPIVNIIKSYMPIIWVYDNYVLYDVPENLTKRQLYKFLRYHYISNISRKNKNELYNITSEIIAT